MSDCFVKFDNPHRIDKLIELHTKYAGSDALVEKTRQYIKPRVRFLQTEDQANYTLVAENAFGLTIPQQL
jgi:hypothetical protein